MAAPGWPKQIPIHGWRPLILLTVGTQLPFDRLVSALDDLAGRFGLDVYGQVGISTVKPKNFPAVQNIAAQDFDQKFRSADVIVAHAGIGTVLSAQKYRKPIILFPRKASLGEHRNEHQTATCNQLENRPGIYVAWTESELERLVADRASLKVASTDDVAAGRGSFVSNLRDYLEQL